MNLPDADLQFAYARLAWGLVLVTVALCLAIRLGQASRARLAWLAGAIAVAQWLPAPWSPAYWLGLAFQAPAGLTVALCAVLLRQRWTGQAGVRVLPPPLAALLATAGALLYLDASGWIAQGLYFAGFGPSGAPLAALLLAAACVLAIARGVGGATAWAVLAAASLFTLARLPTGNLWDAMLDPFLWVASIVVCFKALRRSRRRQPELVGEQR